MEGIRLPSPEEFVDRLPGSARHDLVEWNSGPLRDPYAFVRKVLEQKVPIEELLERDPTAVIEDDRPYNEYYLLRRARRRHD
jgi:hypothetical protein